MRRARRAVALLALASVPGIGALGVIAPIHLSAHDHAAHHEPAHVHAVDLEALGHGHSHTPTTPDHDHPLLVAATSAARLPTAAQPLLAAVHWENADSALAAIPGVWNRTRGARGVGPPINPERHSILRI